MFTPLFTDGVWNTTFNSDLKKYCDFVKNNDTGRVLTNKGGYQSNDCNLSDPILSPLISHIEREANIFRNVFNVQRTLTLDNMWININGPGCYNEDHTHINTFFSGVYYIHTPKNCGNIEFSKPSLHIMAQWSSGFESFNTHNSGRWTLPATKNVCYIFPSYYVHKVLPNENQEKRYSVSFNLS
ncbi:TIGR02466 family protein [Crocinitomicaceae bacterium]|nr:TIGR02466 family protein [Crocinitomicaceae bacterium]